MQIKVSTSIPLFLKVHMTESTLSYFLKFNIVCVNDARVVCQASHNEYKYPLNCVLRSATKCPAERKDDLAMSLVWLVLWEFYCAAYCNGRYTSFSVCPLSLSLSLTIFPILFASLRYSPIRRQSLFLFISLSFL